MFARESLIPLPPRVSPVTAVRNTLIQLSFASIRERGHMDRYLELLDSGVLDLIQSNIAPGWQPIEVAMAHYAACEGLGLDQDEMLRTGQGVGDRLQGTFLSTLARSAKLSGMTPWVLLRNFDRIWSRVVQGGAVQVTQVGPKDAIVECHGMPLARYDYVRLGFSGFFIAGGRLVGARVVNAESVFGRCTADRLSYRVSWA
jgi:hypothetical protein